MSLEVYSRQSKAFQYDGYKINSEMREHINAEKSSLSGYLSDGR